MTREENYFRAVEFRYPAWIPVSVSLMPATWKKYREDLEEIVVRHPKIFGRYKKGSRNFDEFTGLYREGTHTDEWGCLWKNIRGGLDAIVVHHPLSSWDAFESYTPPQPGEGLPHGFMFQRLYYLRGFENLMMDFVDEPPQLHKLIDMVLSYNLAVVRKWVARRPKMVHFGDDLGMQDRLPMSPGHFRKYLKPCYARIFGMCRDAGIHVYFHSDGHILEVIDDLIECGVTVINPQIRANTLDGLVKVCKGKVCVNLDLDRQLFPFCTPKDIEEHVREAVVKLGSRQGGLMLVAECEPDVPLENIEAICQTLERYMLYYS
ncbi:TPA: hypothetical protein EYP37_01575 [Candidatus Poribacteria bacterium]|nr:hypothetical protein [Candidatus Poribacteria bacterium]